MNTYKVTYKLKVDDEERTVVVKAADEHSAGGYVQRTMINFDSIVSVEMEEA